MTTFSSLPVEHGYGKMSFLKIKAALVLLNNWLTMSLLNLSVSFRFEIIILPIRLSSIFSGAVKRRRGRVIPVEWLERLDYGAECRRKVVRSRLGFAMRRLENSLCQPNNKWVPFSN